MSLEINKRELLRYLLSHPSSSYGALCDRLNLSKRSIRLLIESLLYSYNHILSLKEVEGIVSFEVLDAEKLEKLLSQDLLAQTDLNSFHKRQALCFFYLLKSRDFVSAEDIAEALEISRRSLGRDLQRMRLLLEKYQLQLESKTGVGIRLMGTELNKRLLFLYEVIDYLDDPPELPEDIMETYQIYLRNQNLPLAIQRVFLSTLRISWVRRGEVLEEEGVEWFTYKEQLDLPGIFYDVLQYCWQRELTFLEKIFITLPMQVGLIQSKINNPVVHSLATELLEEIILEFGISIPVEESANLLESHMIYLINRSVLHWHATEISVRDDLIKSAFSSVLASHFLEGMSLKTGIRFSRHEVLLLAAWMELLLARQRLPLISRVAVLANSGSSFEYLVSNQLQTFFGSAVSVDFLDFTNHPTYQELNQKYDLIFTDNVLYGSELIQPYFSLSLVTKENQADRERLEKTVLARKIQLSCQVYTFQASTKSGYEENLDCLGRRLVDNKLLTEEGYRQLLAKESSEKTLAATGYAFPHLTVEDLTQLTLIIAPQMAGVKTNRKEEVQDFLLLLIPKYLNEHQQDLLYKIFDNMFRQVSESRVEERLGLNKIDKKQLL